eukprot:CAMPEP_0113405182 /NCGR_PEP_ID=MMETSP0013_2-20120614/18811_1 /TAXON_ID=2843 ORGANISM="Skeletonema costatum, Strain 1716" /NCGR_SAMPLE_ID=MMETSP0013_2 /ASSEMBLY_ACC=CAM_ASM_000158 /LENGTH=421 /DNA_ID=CAMNT_0000290883 /DNA_START=87 /DNA_END=1349 /DNA_ORIENTATION=- /assembly_acc=CAM_ASM_000158
MSNLRSAMKLYQENGDPTSSLRECQKVWNQSSPSASVDDGADDKDDKSAAAAAKMNNNDDVSTVDSSTKELPVSRQHNEAILQNLSAQRQRSRRVRPRPSSFDDNSANTNDDNGGDSNNNAEDTVKNDEQQKSAEKSNNNEGGDLITVLNNILATLSIKNHQQMTPPSKNDDHGQQPLNNNEEVQKLIAVYNLSLAQYAQGEYTEALNELGGVLSRWMDVISVVNNKDGSAKEKNGGKSGGKEADGENKPMVEFKQKDDNTLLHLPLNSNYVTSIMSILTSATFLFLDCSLNAHAGNGRGLMEAGTNIGDDIDEGEKNAAIEKNVCVQDVLKWVENVILVYAKQQMKSDEDEAMGSGGDDDVLTADEVKFKLHLYKSRVLLQGTRGVSGKQQQQKMDGETRARLARKELKNAMDIYQNKLC